MQQQREPQAAAAARGQPPGPVVDQGEVDLARADLAQALSGAGLAELERQAGVVAQAVCERGREGDRGGGEGGEHDLPGRLGLGQVGLGELDHPQDPVGVAGQPPPGVGQLGAARGAVEQGGADLAFEHGELLGDRGGRVAEGFGGRGDGAAVGELAEQA